MQAAPPPTPPNNCVGIASDSNGYGHVTFQLPPDGQAGIIYLRPLAVTLREQLDALGLYDLAVIDHSLPAVSLTASERTNYLKSSLYGGLIKDRCRYIIAGPFIPDVAAAKATPEQYAFQLPAFVGGILKSDPDATIFILNFYYTQRAEFTASNNGFGLKPERIDAFNAAIADFCQPTRPLGRISQVVCVNTQSFFGGMGNGYLLIGATRDEFQQMVYKSTGFKPIVDQFFADNPTAQIIGDGIHLSPAGRVRLTQSMAQLISHLSDF
ncbi:MAG: hypothetical protein ABI947_27740 [Chloroflexota bacterium]